MEVGRSAQGEKVVVQPGLYTRIHLLNDISFFSYFTYLAYIGLCAYYCASGTQTLAYALGWRKIGAGAGYPLQRWPRVLQAMHVVLRATVVTFGEPSSFPGSIYQEGLSFFEKRFW